MDADQLVIAIRRIIVRGGSTLEILRFLDDATDPSNYDGSKPQRAESYEFDAGGNPCETDADLDVPLGEACRLDDDTCDACQ